MIMYTTNRKWGEVKKKHTTVWKTRDNGLIVEVMQI